MYIEFRNGRQIHLVVLVKTCFLSRNFRITSILTNFNTEYQILYYLLLKINFIFNRPMIDRREIRGWMADTSLSIKKISGEFLSRDASINYLRTFCSFQRRDNSSSIGICPSNATNRNVLPQIRKKSFKKKNSRILLSFSLTYSPTKLHLWKRTNQTKPSQKCS